MWILIILILLAVLLSAACGRNPDDGPGMEKTYQQISQETAKQMMQNDKDCVVVDVRRWDEYESGHIPGAVCIPNEEIDSEMPSELPDLDQEILVYCRSGNRSKQAAEKLVKMGYSRVYEFGGILDWTGEVVEGEEPYGGYDMTPTYTPVVTIGEYTFVFEPDNNSAANALISKLEKESLTVELKDNGSGKAGEIPWYLPMDSKEFTAELGTVTLSEGNRLCISCGEEEVTCTVLGRIYLSGREDQFREALSGDTVTAQFWLEWTE